MPAHRRGPGDQQRPAGTKPRRAQPAGRRTVRRDRPPARPVRRGRPARATGWLATRCREDRRPGRHPHRTRAAHRRRMADRVDPPGGRRRPAAPFPGTCPGLPGGAPPPRTVRRYRLPRPARRRADPTRRAHRRRRRRLLRHDGRPALPHPTVATGSHRRVAPLRRYPVRPRRRSRPPGRTALAYRGRELTGRPAPGRRSGYRNEACATTASTNLAVSESRTNCASALSICSFHRFRATTPSVREPTTQSPMMLYATTPLIPLSMAGCQPRAAEARSDTASTFVNVSNAAVTGDDFQSVRPFHSPVYPSGPSSPRSTFSNRCFCVQVGPIDSAVMCLALRTPAWARNSFHVVGGPPIPASWSTFGLYHIRFERWRFTGTE